MKETNYIHQKENMTNAFGTPYVHFPNYNTLHPSRKTHTHTHTHASKIWYRSFVCFLRLYLLYLYVIFIHPSKHNTNGKQCNNTN